MADKNIADRLLGGLFQLCGMLVFACGAFASLGGLGFLLYQCWLWLRDGYWTSFTIGFALGHPPHSTWGGVAQIIDWIWMQPLAAGLIAAGFLVIWIGIFITARGEEIARA